MHVSVYYFKKNNMVKKERCIVATLLDQNQICLGRPSCQKVTVHWATAFNKVHQPGL